MIKAGSLGELAVQLHFAKLGYEVFTPATDNTKHDLLIVTPEGVKTVQVKSSAAPKDHGSYEVLLKSVRANRTGNVIHPFDNNAQDILAVYLEDTETVIIYQSAEITQKHTMRIKSAK